MDTIRALISSVKVILISAGAVALAMAIRFSVPAAVSEAPAVWSIIVTWMKPPYLYIIVNGIIIIILASLRFQQTESHPPLRSEPLVSVETPAAADFESLTAQTEVRTEDPQTADSEAIVVYGSEDRVVELRPVVVNGLAVGMETEEETEADAEPEAEAEPDYLFLDSNLGHDRFSQVKLPPKLQLEYHLSREKPLVSSSSESTTEEMRSLTEAEPGSLESTWKMIMQGRHAPLKEDLKSSDTWGRHVQKPRTFKDRTSHHDSTPGPASSTIWKEDLKSSDTWGRQVQKSQTFKDRTSHHYLPPGPASSTIWKETSPSQDELNGRFDAFIEKFYDEMRLQRQESLKQHLKMSNGRD